ncbi:MAG: pyridoxamine 5'-phosphate oxidase family protein [Thermodesulfobacteriota bacterium]
MAATLERPVRAFLAEQPVGVLATTRRDGSIRQSVVYHVTDGDRILISTVADRGKAHDVRRTGRASYAVLGHEKPFPQVVVDGPARILEHGIAEPTMRIFERIGGSRPPTPLTDQMLAGMKRVIVEITIESVKDVSYVGGVA